VLRWYGFDSETHKPVDPSNFRPYLEGKRRAYVMVGGRQQFFPRRELDTIDYNVEAAYQGLYQQIRAVLGRAGRVAAGTTSQGSLTYARYGLWHFVKPKKRRSEPYASLEQAGPNIRGLMRVLLFKRLESSVFAFRETVRRLIVAHDRFLAALRNGIIAAGEDAQTILHEADELEEDALIEALKRVSGRYSADDFEVDRLKVAIEHDLQLLREVMALIEPITPLRDAKLQTLLSRLETAQFKDGKTLIFTQYADTARYLYDNLNPDGLRTDIDVIYSGDKSKARIVGRFAPRANPEYRFGVGETELMTVVATDVLAEGLNLQDCNKVVNYDLHWNPVRLIQRFGRIDRIGSDHDVIFAFNFLPELGIERNLHLRERLAIRIQEIHDTIGEDAAVLDRSERLNEEAMYAIYEKKGGQLGLFEDEEEEVELVDLAEAEEMLRLLRRETPDEFHRIAALKDGIRSSRLAGQKGTFVFCEAGRFQQLFQVNPDGEVVTRDVPVVLTMIKAGPEVPSELIPVSHAEVVGEVKRRFAQEVRQRNAELQHTLGLSQAQRFVLRELRLLHGAAEDDEVKAQIGVLEPAFRGSLTNAIQRELNVVRRSGLAGSSLLQALARIYHQHNMASWTQEDRARVKDTPPIIVCSEALV
jgi:Helicase conserved C-terminal domain